MFLDVKMVSSLFYAVVLFSQYVYELLTSVKEKKEPKKGPLNSPLHTPLYRKAGANIERFFIHDKMFLNKNLIE